MKALTVYKNYKVISIMLITVLGSTLLQIAQGNPPGEENNLYNLNVFSNKYPKGFFSVSSAFDTDPNEYPRNYEDWEDLYSRLNGITGRMFKEAVPGQIFQYVPAYFSQFKQEHTDQMILFQIDGFARNKEDEAEQYSAGNWLYFEGCGITQDIPADENIVDIYVTDPDLFTEDYRATYNDPEGDPIPDQICICFRNPTSGNIDWNQSEQVRLISKNASYITVERENPSTSPWVAGETYIAPHVLETFKSVNRIAWVYNLSTTCPEDENGKTASDIFVQEIVNWFSPGGFCESFDGIEFDCSTFEIEPLFAGIGDTDVRIIDVDGNGEGDNCNINGINVYGIGTFYFHQDLRTALGNEKMIFAEGNNSKRTRSLGILTGINSEGFPNHYQSGYPGYANGITGMPDWSGGINRLMFWKKMNDPGDTPTMIYIDHKASSNLPKEGYPPVGWPDAHHNCVPLNYTRLVLAVAQCVGAAVDIVNSAYWVDPHPEPDQPQLPYPNSHRGVWDELRQNGDANWLGGAVGDVIRLGKDSEDLLSGAGVDMTPSFVQNWTSDNAYVSVVEPYPGGKKYLKIKELPVYPPPENLSLEYPNLQIPPGDLLIYCEIQANPMYGYPDQIPRLVHLSCDCYGQEPNPPSLESTMTFACQSDFPAVFYWRNAGGASGRTVTLRLDIESTERVLISNFTVHQGADALAREFENGVVLVNPSTDPYEFNLSELFPGVSGFKRLSGDWYQCFPPGPIEYQLYIGPNPPCFITMPWVPWKNALDLWENTGASHIGNPITITVDQRDAIFLKKIE
jgi:hypothetical protein